MYCRQSFAWSLQCSCWCSWCWCCRCISYWQSHCLGSRSWYRCNWCYIANVGCVWFDSIWMMNLNVVMSMSTLSATNDLDLVGAIIGFADDGRREPLVSSVIEDRYSLAGKEWRFLAAASLVMALCTLGGILVETVPISIDMCGSVCLIPCGTVVHSAHWYYIFTGEWKCTGGSRLICAVVKPDSHLAQIFSQSFSLYNLM